MDKENMNVDQLEEEISKKNEEILSLRDQIDSMRNKTLEQLSEKIFDKVFRHNLPYSDRFKSKYVYNAAGGEKLVEIDTIVEGMILKIYENNYDGYPMEEIADPNTLEPATLSVTFNVGMDDDLRSIINSYGWEKLGHSR